MKSKKRKPPKKHARQSPFHFAKMREEARLRKGLPVGAGEKDNPSLGENIRTARSNAGITQLALAHAIGYNGADAGAYISRVESGAQEPRLDTLSRIAEALGVTTCSLLPG